jgi:hypothetical protein
MRAFITTVFERVESLQRRMGSVSNLVPDLHGLVDRVLIDQMNYSRSIRSFYRQAGLESAIGDDFFLEYKARINSELKKRKIEFEAVF